MGESLAGVSESVHTILFFTPDSLYTLAMPDTERARALRKKPTWAEKLVWGWLRDRRFSAYKFRRGHPVGIYFLDFYCREASLSIELDGGAHGHPDQQVHDEERTKFLASIGIKELRFWNSRLRRDKQAIRDTIFRELQSRAPHPLPDYTKPMEPTDVAGKTRS
jgi:very-short-patch-repair endonuclease